MFKLNKKVKQAGMTYVELIVVLGVFSTLASVVLFKYGDFQSQVDIKNLASDIALQIVTAQKSALSGLQPVQIPTVSPWKPEYGIYFNTSSGPDSNGIPFNQRFIYFVDLDNSASCSDSNCSGESLNKISITKSNYISSLDSFNQNDVPTPLSDLTVTFARPSSGAVLFSNGAPILGASYVQITIASPNNATASAIKIYPSVRILIGTPTPLSSGGFQYGSSPAGGGGTLLGGDGNTIDNGQ